MLILDNKNNAMYGVFRSHDREMINLKIPTGINAHKDTTYIHIHGKNSAVHKQFTMIVNNSTKFIRFVVGVWRRCAQY